MKDESNADNNIEAKINMDESMENGGVKTFPTLVPKTCAIVFKSQHETQETEGGNEGKFKSDVKDDIKAKVSEAVNQRQIDSFAHVPETWTVVTKSQHETQEGGSEELKVEADACNEDRSIIKAYSIKRVNGYETHEFEEISMENDVCLLVLTTLKRRW